MFYVINIIMCVVFYRNDKDFSLKSDHKVLINYSFIGLN